MATVVGKVIAVDTFQYFDNVSPLESGNPVVQSFDLKQPEVAVVGVDEDESSLEERK